MNTKAPYSTVKAAAKTRLKDNLGSPFFIVIVIDIIYYLIRYFLTTVIPTKSLLTELIVSDLSAIIIFGLSLLVITKLLLDYVRGNNEVPFRRVFDFDQHTFKFIFLNALFYIPAYVTSVPLLIYLVTLFDIEIEEDLAYQTFTMYYDTSPNHLNYVILSLVLFLILMYIKARLSFTKYLIIDKSLSLKEALKASWSLTQTNGLRVLFFSLSYALWFLLIPLTLGLVMIYLIPYIVVGQIYLYEIIREENGENIQRYHKQPTPFDPLDIDQKLHEPN